MSPNRGMSLARSVPAAAAAAAAEAASAAGAGPGFVDRQGTALEVLAVESGNGLVGLFLVRHIRPRPFLSRRARTTLSTAET